MLDVYIEKMLRIYILSFFFVGCGFFLFVLVDAEWKLVVISDFCMVLFRFAFLFEVVLLFFNDVVSISINNIFMAKSDLFAMSVLMLIFY